MPDPTDTGSYAIDMPPTESSPRQVLEDWIKCFNAADCKSLAALYADDALVEQVAYDQSVTGIDAIRACFEFEFARADMRCIPERIYECGDTVIMQWRDPNGLQGCGFFQVEQGLIRHQKGYFDQLSFLRAQGLPLPGNGDAF